MTTSASEAISHTARLTSRTNSAVRGRAYPDASSKSSMPSTSMNVPPTDSICSAAERRTSEAKTTAPMRLEVEIACRPATPLPMTTTRPGRTVPAEVVIIGIARLEWAMPISAAA